MNLEELRRRIDEKDQRILELFSDRMEIVRKIAEHKKENKIEVFDPSREEAILDSVGSRVEDWLQDYVRVLFTTIMDVSKAIQRNTIGGNKELEAKLMEGMTESALDFKGANIGVAGAKGSFTAEAALKLAPSCNLNYYKDFGEVFEAVEKNEVEYGVVPVENSSAGSVSEVYDLLIKYNFYIIMAIANPIEHCLLALREADIGDIKNIYSHPQALAQCSSFLAEMSDVNINEYSNTAAAASFISKAGDRSNAVIASENTADLYNLKILKSGIQNQKLNETRFILFSKKLHIIPQAEKISIIFALPHVTGSLYRSLARFSMHGFNLTKIESRVIPDKKFEYLFYLDFTGNLRNKAAREFLTGLSEELPMFRFLGNYPEKQ